MPRIQSSQHGAEWNAALVQQHEQVKEQVSALVDQAVVVLRHAGQRRFQPLFAHFLRDLEAALCKQPRGIAALWRGSAARGNDAFEFIEEAGARRLFL